MLDTLQKISAALAVLRFGTAVGVMSMSPPLFSVAKGCVIGAAASLAVLAAIWSYQSNDPLALRIVLGAITGIVVITGGPYLIKMIDVKEQLTLPPNITMRLVYPVRPSLQIINLSDSTARDIKYGAAIWNLDAPDPRKPLPIPWQTLISSVQKRAGGRWIYSREASRQMVRNYLDQFIWSVRIVSHQKQLLFI
jgi:hypothetical protein